MKYHRYQIGPAHTPFIIKFLLATTASLSLLCAFQVSFFPGFPLQYWLGLSWMGFKEGFFFQPFTYFFVVLSYGISLGFLFNLFVHLYLLWMFGVSLVERCGVKNFSILFFGSGIFAGLIALFVMAIGYPYYQFAGSSTVIYAYLISWIILNPHSQIRIFFTMPMKTKWLILAILGFNLLSALSRWDFVLFFSYLSAASFGYFFTLIFYLIQSPFPFLHRMEKKVLQFLQRKKKEKLQKKSKDEEFMDTMLNKISIQGEESLTWLEKKRMKKISKKRKSSR